jgi:oligopeptide/dipeptide ABC transporter ATP-binding protein
MTMALLEIDGLHVRLGKHHRTILHDVSLRVDRGEAVGLVGESGSGKSTTASAILRSLGPSAIVKGSIRFDGVEIYDLSTAELRNYHATDVSMIYQDPRAHTNPVRTVGDAVTEALVHGRSMDPQEAWSRAADLLHEVGITDSHRRMRQYPHELSGGMLQRVMIAAALLTEPRLLLADEPTSALDVTTQEDVMAILDEQRHERDLALILITHDLDLAVAMMDRIVVMYAGVVVEVAPSTALPQDAMHPYTAALHAARPGSRTGRRLPTIPGRPVAAYEAGPGCVFASRCPFVEQRCVDERPALRMLDGHRVACHLAEHLRGKMHFETIASDA